MENTDTNFVHHQSAPQTTASDNSGEFGKPKKKSKFPIVAVVIIVLVILALIIGVPVLIQSFTGSNSGSEEVTPTPTVAQQAPAPTTEPTPSVEKKDLSVSVLNGTGIPKEAAHLQGILVEMGYEDIKAGNADSQDYESAVISFSETVPGIYKQELLTKLEDTYTSVRESSTEPNSVDIEIITGTRPGVTKPPTPKATEKPEETPTPTPEDETTPTTTPTGSPTQTPTPTP